MTKNQKEVFYMFRLVESEEFRRMCSEFTKKVRFLWTNPYCIGLGVALR